MVPKRRAQAEPTTPESTTEEEVGTNGSSPKRTKIDNSRPFERITLAREDTADVVLKFENLFYGGWHRTEVLVSSNSLLQQGGSYFKGLLQATNSRRRNSDASIREIVPKEPLNDYAFVTALKIVHLDHADLPRDFCSIQLNLLARVSHDYDLTPTITYFVMPSIEKHLARNETEPHRWLFTTWAFGHEEGFKRVLVRFILEAVLNAEPKEVDGALDLDGIAITVTNHYEPDVTDDLPPGTKDAIIRARSHILECVRGYCAQYQKRMVKDISKIREDVRVEANGTEFERMWLEDQRRKLPHAARFEPLKAQLVRYNAELGSLVSCLAGLDPTTHKQGLRVYTKEILNRALGPQMDPDTSPSEALKHLRKQLEGVEDLVTEKVRNMVHVEKTITIRGRSD